MTQFAKKIGSLPMENNLYGTVHVLALCDGNDAGAMQISPIDCVADTIFPKGDHANHQYRIAKSYHWQLGSTFAPPLPNTFGSHKDASNFAIKELGYGWHPFLVVDQYEAGATPNTCIGSDEQDFDTEAQERESNAHNDGPQ